MKKDNFETKEFNDNSINADWINHNAFIQNPSSIAETYYSNPMALLDRELFRAFYL